jgi:tRNA (mo5U34)-methyltransferase
MTSAPVLTEGARAEVQREVDALGPWFHNFEIVRDLWTNAGGAGPGADYPARRWAHVEKLFRDLQGKDCLDVGCSSGFFSLKAKELGAISVLGVDHGEQQRAIDQARFAAKVLQLEVNFRTMSAYDLATLPNRFDVVLFMGVFYHLRHPLVALDAIRAVCKDRMIFQTITTSNKNGADEIETGRMRNVGLASSMMGDSRFPTLRFVEGSLDGDASCWFVPNLQAVFAMLRASGFAPGEVIFPGEHEVIVDCRVL